MEQGENAQNERFHLFRQCFVCNTHLKSFKSHISVSSAASLNLGHSQNGLLGNGLIFNIKSRFHTD